MASTHFARRDTAPSGAPLNRRFTRADWRHVYRSARVMRDAFGGDPSSRSPMDKALLALHNQLPTPIYMASVRAALTGRAAARRAGDLLGVFHITDGALRRYRAGSANPRLPA